MRAESFSGAIALIAHSHPRFSKGGAEILAHRAFLDFRERGLPAILLATVPPSLPGSRTLFREDEDSIAIGDGEYLIRSGTIDPVLGVQPSTNVAREILRLSDRHGVGVFHFHHFLHVGLDAIDMVRRARPDARVGLTLHELMAICLRDGQMLKRPKNQLCHRSDPVDCHVCFPEFEPDVFRLRDAFVRAVLERLDFRTAPSRFLAGRVMMHWPDIPVGFVDNGTHVAPSRDRIAGPPPASRFAFFGQPTPYKGVDMFIRAASLVLDRHGPVGEFHIFGLTEKDCFESLDFGRLASIVERWPGQIVFRGPYDHDDVGELMEATAWVVVPSIWWENAPLVIQEAFSAGRPVLCSGIGGMAEKVRHEVDGLHVRKGDPSSLADAMHRCLSDPTLWPRLASGIVPPRTIGAMNDEFLALYFGSSAEAPGGEAPPSIEKPRQSRARTRKQAVPLA